MTLIATQYLTPLREIDLDYALEISACAVSIPFVAFVVLRTITKYITALFGIARIALLLLLLLLLLLEELVGGERERERRQKELPPD
jgi:hypothetical protein